MKQKNYTGQKMNNNVEGLNEYKHVQNRQSYLPYLSIDDKR